VGFSRGWVLPDAVDMAMTPSILLPVLTGAWQCLNPKNVLLMKLWGTYVPP
jgi:hypothetical protein